MKILKLTFILICCVSFSCSYFENVSLLTSGEILRKDYVQTLPFEWQKELIVVRAKLNSDTTLREFIFDTGAFNSKVESELVNSLGIETITQKNNSTAQGITQRIEVVQIDSLQIGETTVYNLGAGKLSYAPTSASPCIAASGIIGANLIKLAHWKIDYEMQLLHFSDSAFEVEEGSIVLPFERPLLSGTPKVDIEIDGKRVENILFDVGYNGALVLPLSLAKHFENSQTKIILDRSTSGIYGTKTDSLLVKNLDVSVGGAKVHMPVAFSSHNKALLGNEFLKHFTVIINNDARKIYLQKQKKVKILPTSEFMVAIHNDSIWTVSRTSPDLEIRLGETLLSVNGKMPKELFSSHCDYVMNVAKVMEDDSLIVQRMNGTFLKIPVK